MLQLSEDSVVTLIVSLIGAILGPLLILIVGWILNHKIKIVKNSVNVTKESVVNSHKSGLRDDLDSKFKLVFAKLETISTVQRHNTNAIMGLRDDYSDVYKRQAQLVEQMSDIQSRRGRNSTLNPGELH